MTKAQLDAIKRRAEKATLGPWRLKRLPYFDGFAVFEVNEESRGRIASLDKDCYQAHYDGEFIAAARIDVPVLVAELERLWKFLAIAFRNWAEEPDGSQPEHCEACRDKAEYYNQIEAEIEALGGES